MAKKIYLAGAISGLTYEEAQDWRTDFAESIDPRIECFSPLRGKEYLTMRGPLEGSYDEFPLSTDRGITVRDRNDCMGADLVVFNMLGAKRVSIGTMVEFGWADAARVPSVLIMEKTGNVHEYPMVREIASFRVDNVADAIAIAEVVLLHKTTPKAAALTPNRRSSAAPKDRRSEVYTNNNPRHSWNRAQSLYASSGRDAVTGDRRK
jgi:nucleoside 2-deoxyribosyltransferase